MRSSGELFPLRKAHHYPNFLACKTVDNFRNSVPFRQTNQHFCIVILPLKIARLSGIVPLGTQYR